MGMNRGHRWELLLTLRSDVRRDRGALATVALLVSSVIFGSCSSHPVASTTTDRALPSGWVRYSYGALSVGAPRGWPTYSYVPLCPPSPGTTAIVEFTETTAEAASCAVLPENGTSRVIALGCLTGAALGQFAIGSPSDTAVVAGRLLRRSDTQMSLRGNGWEATFMLLPGFAPPGLGQEILGTVRPTGRPCV